MLNPPFGGLISLFRSQRDLALENLVLRYQLQVALRTNPSANLLDQDRIFWVWAHRLWPSCGAAKGHPSSGRTRVGMLRAA
jgi:hypothetical protein